MTRTMNIAFHFRLGFMVKVLDPELDESSPWSLKCRGQAARIFPKTVYFTSSGASTCVIAERAIRIFTGDDPVSAIFNITVSPSNRLSCRRCRHW